MDNEKRHDIDIQEVFKEIDKITASLEKKEYDGQRDILKYSDRIHDKLFAFNNIMIVSFFAISKIWGDISLGYIFIPLLNMVFLVLIEYGMMEKSSTEAKIRDLNMDRIEEHKKFINRLNQYSLFCIFSTSFVLIAFIFLFLH